MALPTPLTSSKRLILTFSGDCCWTLLTFSGFFVVSPFTNSGPAKLIDTKEHNKKTEMIVFILAIVLEEKRETIIKEWNKKSFGRGKNSKKTKVKLTLSSKTLK